MAMNCSKHRTFAAGCTPCQTISARYARRRHQRIKDGTWQLSVPVDEVRQHITNLKRSGMTVAAISRASGIPAQTIHHLDHPTRVYVTGATAGPLLAVQPAGAVLRKGMVPAVGTTRRVQALSAIGWSIPEVARRLGVRIQTVANWAHGAVSGVDEVSHDAVAALFNQLELRPGPRARARSTARKYGWVSPLAWDEEAIDDPAAKPTGTGGDQRRLVLVDDAAVDRALGGDPSTLTRQVDRRAAIERMCRAGYPAETIAARLRMNVEAVNQARQRHRLTAGKAAA